MKIITMYGDFLVILHSKIGNVRQPLGADTHYLFRANLQVCHPKIRENVTNIVSIVALRSVEYSGK